MHYYFDVLKKYAVTKGRATRKEYWMFVLWNIIVSFIIGLITGIIGAAMGINLSFVSWIYVLFILIPSLAVAVRRLQDTNHSGWWLLIGLVPIIGAIILIVFFVIDSQPGENKYGQNPKGITALQNN